MRRLLTEPRWIAAVMVAYYIVRSLTTAPLGDDYVPVQVSGLLVYGTSLSAWTWAALAVVTAISAISGRRQAWVFSVASGAHAGWSTTYAISWALDMGQTAHRTAISYAMIALCLASIALFVGQAERERGQIEEAMT